MRLNINGVGYYVEVHGSGPALLLLHGFSGNHKQWEPFLEDWSRFATLICVDLLGHGKTDAPLEANRYETKQTVNDLVTIMDQLNIAKATVLGYSMGGRIAISLAQLARSRVETLILESTSPGIADEDEREARMQSDQLLAKRIEEQGMEWFVPYWGELPLFSSVKKLPQAEQLKLTEQRSSHMAQGLANSLRGIGTGAQPSWWAELNQLAIPTLLIVGEWDEKFRSIAQLMKKDMTQAEVSLEVVASAGHNVHIEQPQCFATIVQEYMISRKGKV